MRLTYRPRFSVALVGLVALLTAATGGTIGVLTWRENRASSQALVDTALTQVARLVAEQAGRFLRDAESAVRLGPELVRQGLLDPDDPAALEQYTLGVLRVDPSLSWVSYGDRGDRFVGAWRDEVGDVFVNHSFPRAGRIRLEEDRILADGRREPARRSDDHGYRPRERPYFRLAEARRTVAWTEPYEFYAGGGLGITCVAPLLDDAGGVRGAFTVDFSLYALADFLDGVHVSARGRAFITTREGVLVVAPHDSRGTARRVDAALAREIGRQLDTAGAPLHRFEFGGEAYVGRAVPLAAAAPPWLVAVVVPERDYTASVDAQARRTGMLALLALGVAVAGGVAMARWIARPLRELMVQARRVRQGDLSVSFVSRSHDEIGSLARSMAEMVEGLRDRDFIRDTLGRYVSPELAAQCLRDRDALRLGGEARDVSLLMSDLRDFSELSQQLGPEAMIQLLNRYLAHMTRVILEHRGMIDEFIGDAILVLFGAPFQQPDDAERAVRCAWAMQEAMRGFNEESRALGLPGLVMGIAVHTGVVVAGNIGGPDRVKYGVVGPAVNLTARIEALTKGPQILVSEATYLRSQHMARVGPSRGVVVKGSPEPVTVYELLGVTAVEPSPSPLGPPDAQNDSPLVGR